MIIKKIIIINDNDIIGIKYNLNKKECILGGTIKLREYLENILINFFNINEINLPEYKIISNKGKFTINNINWITFKKIIRNLQDNYYNIQNIDKLGSIMR